MDLPLILPPWDNFGFFSLPEARILNFFTVRHDVYRTLLASHLFTAAEVPTRMPRLGLRVALAVPQRLTQLTGRLFRYSLPAIRLLSRRLIAEDRPGAG